MSKNSVHYNAYYCRTVDLNTHLTTDKCGPECRQTYTHDFDFFNNYNQCRSCSKGCYSCTSVAPEDCTSCHVGYWRDTVAATCNMCFMNCQICSGGRFDQCTRCDEGYYWTKNQYNSEFIFWESQS